MNTFYVRPSVTVFRRVVESHGRRLFVLFGIIFVFFLLVIKVYYDTNSIEVHHYEIAGSPLGEALGGLKVAFVSDLHIERIGSRETRLLEILNEERPDLLFIGGDLIPFRGPYTPVFSFFDQLKTPLGIYAVLGNTEYSNENGSCTLCHEERSKELKETRTPAFLRNSSVALNVHGKKINLLGVDDPVHGRDRLELAMRHATPQSPSILLAHSPVIFEAASNRGVDLILSGHNHGGQLFFTKFLRKIFPLDPGLELLEGFFQKGKSLLYVGRGVGTSYLPFRLGVKPEITFFSFVGSRSPSKTAATMSVKNSSPTTLFCGLNFPSLAETFGLFELFHTFLTPKRQPRDDRPSNVLFDFESERDLEQVNWECHKWFELSTGDATSGFHSLKVSLPSGPSPGVEFKDIRRDWSSFLFLKMDVTNPSGEDVNFHIRIDDHESGWEYADRFDINLILKPGLNNISIATDSIRTNLHARPLDLENIKRLMVSIPQNPRMTDLFIDNIRLE